MAEIGCDILVVGGTLGGCAAALAAGEMGARVCLVERTHWLGGQLTVQGVCTPDENQWIETTGCTARYAALRQSIRDHYRNHYLLSEAASSNPRFNPGSCWVSRLSVEPRVGAQLLLELLRNSRNGADIQIVFNARPIHAKIKEDRIQAITFSDADGQSFQATATQYIDATDLGDLLPLTGTEYRLGAESQDQTGEPDAPPDPHPDWIQPFTFPFALEIRPYGENHIITPPPDFDELSHLQLYRFFDGAITGAFTGKYPWWNYRRIIAVENFEGPHFQHDISMINTGSNDYQGGNLFGGEKDASYHLARARQASLGYLYWLQAHAPREDGRGGSGYPELRLVKELFDTEDGVAPMPYIRESRRIVAMNTIREQDIVTCTFEGEICNSGSRARAFTDTVGIGHYWLDIHPGGSGEPGRFMETKPFQIPAGALVPQGLSNLLAGCKNIGVTHLTNGAYRLHPIEWAIGEAAGTLAALCVQSSIDGQTIIQSRTSLRRLQHTLLRCGAPICWLTDIPHNHPAFEAAHLLFAAGIWPLSDTDLQFRPDDLLSQSEAIELLKPLSPRIMLPSATLFEPIRADRFAVLLAEAAQTDATSAGILDPLFRRPDPISRAEAAITLHSVVEAC